MAPPKASPKTAAPPPSARVVAPASTTASPAASADAPARPSLRPDGARAIPAARPSGAGASMPPAGPPSARDAGRARGRPKGPFTQHRRLDALRALLQRHPKGLTIYELARELGVTPRSLRRYLSEVKREIDLVCTTERPGGPRLWRLAPNEVPRKVEVRRTQAYALLAARRLFEPMRGSTLYEEIDLATQKLFAVARRPGRGPNAGVADARLEDRFLYLPFAPKDYQAHTEELDDLFQAVADLRPLRCRYRRAKDGQEERVTIHPYAMVLYKDAVYCVGLHVGKNEIRTFLLDRMRDTECAVSERFDLPPDFKVDDYFQGQFGIWRGAEGKRVVIDFDARVAEFVRTRRVHPSQELTPLPKGGVRMTMMIGDLTELATWILGFGETARVVEPPDLVERVTKELEGALSLYGKLAKKPPRGLTTPASDEPS
jgi:predicted DNA-binding transcriptional regulator YafY